MHFLSVASSLTWRRSHYWNDPHRSLCTAFTSFVVMTHQEYIIDVDASMTETKLNTFTLWLFVKSGCRMSKYEAQSSWMTQFVCPPLCCLSCLEASQKLYKWEPIKLPRKSNWHHFVFPPQAHAFIPTNNSLEQVSLGSIFDYDVLARFKETPTVLPKCHSTVVSEIYDWV